MSKYSETLKHYKCHFRGKNPIDQNREYYKNGKDSAEK